MSAMKSMRAWLLIGLSLVFGGISAFAIDRHLTAKTEEIELRNRVALAARVVAAHDLKRGTVLQLSDLATRDIPVQWLIPDAIEVENVLLASGKQLNADVLAGQPILGLYLSDRVSPALSTKLEPGRRAITIPVDQINSMSGLLNPTDQIDLYVSFEHHGKRVTASLLSGVQVLATGHHTAAPSDKCSAVNTAMPSCARPPRPQRVDTWQGYWGWIARRNWSPYR